MKKIFILLSVCLPLTWASGQPEAAPLTLHGSAVHRAAGIFKVLNGFLYLESPKHAEDILSDVPKKLEFVYLRKVKADLLIKNSLETLAENQSPQKIESIQERVNRVNALFKDVIAGDRYGLYYQPGVGTELSYNGAVVDCIPGADFAALYFSIWFGDNPLSKSFKARVLRGDKL